MIVPKSKTLLFISVLIACMAGIASWAGLYIDGVYRDNALVISAWKGNDIITLFAVIPMFLISMLYTLKGSNKGRLFWMGSLWYMVYNYVFYLFGAAFNPFFLLYAALVVCSVYTLVFALFQTDVEKFRRSFREKLPYKFLSLFMLFFGMLLGGMWIALSLSSIFTGQVHVSITQTDHPTAIVFAIDLTLLVPSLIFSAALLWQKKSWGPIVSSVVLIKATAYGLALVAMTFNSYQNTKVVDPFISLWILLTVGCALSLTMLMRKIN